MIRLHTGRGWRFNTRLLAELRAGVGKGARPAPIMDVLGVEVDGIDIFAGLTEDRVVQVTADLVAAVTKLMAGQRRAQVSCSGGSVQLLLERRGEAAFLTMARLRRPSATLVRDLELDLHSLSVATERSGAALVVDLRRIHPKLTQDPPAMRLLRVLQVRRQTPLREAPPISRPAPAAQAGAQSVRGRGFHVMVESDRLLETFTGGTSDLLSLMSAGRIELTLGGVPPTWTAEGVPFLLLRDLVQSGLELVRALERGDNSHDLSLSANAALEFPLAGCEDARLVRTSKGRPPAATRHPCEPGAVLGAIFDAAVAFGALAARQNPRQLRNRPLAALVDDAREGLLRMKDLPGAPAAAPPAAVGAARPERPEPQLLPGRLKRLDYHQLWEQTLPGTIRALAFGRRGALIARGDDVVASLAKDGKTHWLMRGDFPVVAWDATSIFTAQGNVVRACTPSGVELWRRGRLPGSPAALAVVPAASGRGNVLAVAAGTSVTALAAGDGAALWRFSPPGAARVGTLATPNGQVLVTTGDGRLYGIAAATGKLLFRAHGQPLLDAGGRSDELLVSAEGALWWLSTGTGARRSVGQAQLDRAVAWLTLRGRRVVVGLQDGRGQVVALHEDGALAWSWGDPDGGRTAPSFPRVAALTDGVLVRGQKALVCLDTAGKQRWRYPLSEQENGGVALWTRRGVALAADEKGVVVLDVEGGSPLTRIECRDPSALAVDARLSVVIAAEDGPVRAFHVRRLMSVV